MIVRPGWLPLALAFWAGCVGPPSEREPGEPPCSTATEARRWSVLGRDPEVVVREAMAVTGPPTEVEWARRAPRLRDEVWRLAGLTRSGRPSPRVTTIGERTIAGVRLVDLVIEGYDGMAVPALLYLPAGATEPVPGVLVNVGHDASGQSAGYVRTLAWSLAAGGVAAMTIDWLGMGTRFADDQRHIPLGLRSYLPGLLPAQPLLEEPLRAWEVLAGRPEVDPARVAMIGQSGGGMVTMHLAAMEPRIAAAVVVDLTATNGYLIEDSTPGWGDPDSFLPGFHGSSSHGELLALIAPRPLLVLTGDDDAIAPTAIARTEVAIARVIYDAHRVAASLVHEGFPSAHCYCDPKIVRTLAFLGDVLAGRPIARVGAPAGTEPRALLPADAPRWPDLLPPRLATTPSLPATAAAGQEWIDQARAGVAAIFPGVPSTAAAIQAALAPDVPSGCAVATLWVSDVGQPAPDTLDRPGVWTLELEPAGQGNGFLDGSVDQRRYATQEALMVGQPHLAQGVDDLRSAAHAVRALGASRVVVICEGAHAALLCATAAVLDVAIDGVALAGLPGSFADLLPLEAQLPTGYYTMPGLAHLASPEMLLALIAPRPVVIFDDVATPLPFARDLAALLGAPWPAPEVTSAADAASLILAAIR